MFLPRILVSVFLPFLCVGVSISIPDLSGVSKKGQSYFKSKVDFSDMMLRNWTDVEVRVLQYSSRKKISLEAAAKCTGNCNRRTQPTNRRREQDNPWFNPCASGRVAACKASKFARRQVRGRFATSIVVFLRSQPRRSSCS